MNKKILIASAGLALFGAQAAWGSLIHRYSFTTDASDSVGTADGTLRTPSTISGGTLNTTNGTTGNNGGVSLPGSATSGITGAFSIETYVTATTDVTNANLFSFAPTVGNHVEYYAATSNTTGVRTFYNAPGGSNYANERSTGFATMSTGVQHQVVSVYSPTGGSGTTPGTLSLYFDGNFVGSVQTELINLSSTGALGAIASSVPFGDPNFNGATDDFRIYDQALTDSQVSALDSLGANATNADILGAVPEPGSIALLAASGLGLLARRRRA